MQLLNDSKKNKRISKMIAEADIWILKGDACFKNLIGLKRQYFPRLTPKPLERMLIQIVPPSFPEVDVDLSGLAFIPKRFWHLDKEVSNSGFENIGQINSMFRGYNLLLHKWRKRNDLARIAGEKIARKYPGLGYDVTISPQALLDTLGGLDIAILIVETEEAISRTDDILKKILDFQQTFPGIVQNAIPKSLFSKIKEGLGARQKPDTQVLGATPKTDTINFALKTRPIDEKLRDHWTSRPSPPRGEL